MARAAIPPIVLAVSGTATSSATSHVARAARLFYSRVFPAWAFEVPWAACSSGEEEGGCAVDAGLHTAWRLSAYNGQVVIGRAEAVWADFLTQKGEGASRPERACARALAERLGWRVQVPIPFPGAEYITMFTPRGELVNGNKLAGILPRHLLLPPHDYAAETSAAWWKEQALRASGTDSAQGAAIELDFQGVELLPFFEMRSKGELESALERVGEGSATAVGEGGSGQVVKEPFEADGDVAIARDPFGAYFALYHRTDVADQVKSGTALIEVDEL